jgi:predicted membrane protein
MKTKTIGGVFSLILALCITLFILLSNKEYGLLSLLIPLFFIILGIYLLKKKVEKKD